MSIKSQVALLLFIIIDLMNFMISSEVTIKSIDPTVIKTSSSQSETIMSIIFEEDITERTQTTIQLKLINGTKIIEYQAYKSQDPNNLKKVYFQILHSDFKDKHNKYYLYFYSSQSEESKYNDTILIYENDIILINPLNRYFLSNAQNQGDNRTTYFTFKSAIIPEEIYKIEFYKESNTDLKKELNKSDYTVDGSKLRLNVILRESSFDFKNVNSYIFNIYPEYDRQSTNSFFHQFKIHFFDYLLLTDAIYVRKESNTTNLNISFTTKNITNLFSIVDSSGKSYSYISFNCENSIDSTYKCKYELTISKKEAPEIFTIKYNSVQQTQIFMFPYQTNIEKCYSYGQEDVKTLYIIVYLGNDMEYNHEIYFNDVNHKQFTESLYDLTSKKYTISFSSLQAGNYYIYSVIPNLGENQNFIDEDVLNVFIYPGDSSFVQGNSFIYYNNDTDQIINISSSDGNYVDILDEIKLENQNNKGVEITVSRKEGQCQVSTNKLSFICVLNNKINNQETKIEGIYKIIYKNSCNNEKEISGRTITIKQGFNLMSISPTWINKTKVTESELTLEYNTDLSSYVDSGELKIHLKENRTDQFINEYNVSNLVIGKSNKIQLTLKEIKEGIYYFETIVDEGKDGVRYNKKNKTLIFKVSTPITNFTFDHHYFVLRNNTDSRNYLNITVNDNTGEFGCNISEQSENKVLNESNNCKSFRYDISKTGTIKFDYYDKDGFIIPINDNILVYQTYSTYFTLKHKYCYYYEFDISLSLNNKYKNNKMEIYAFLETEDKSINISLNNESSKFTFRVPSNDNKYLNASYYLYITEGFEDKEGAYLYKSNNKIELTGLEAPKYIINPYLKVNFSNVKCNLTDTTLKIQKVGSSLGTNLGNCEYFSGNNILECSLQNNFYSLKQYQNFSYFIDEKEIKSFDKNETYITFISNKLSDSDFKITNNIDDARNINIIIENTNKDFYFPILESLSTYLIKNGENNSYLYKIGDSGFSINSQNYTVSLNVSHGLNFKLDINNLKRNKTFYDDKVDDPSFHHYFDDGRFIENTLYELNQTIFIFNDPNEDYNITIDFKTEEMAIQYSEFKNLKCDRINNIYNCLVNITNSTKAQNVNVSIINKDNLNDTSETTIKFIYYSLANDTFTNCVTKTENMGNLSLYIDFPDTDLMDITELSSSFLGLIDYDQRVIQDKRITYYIKGDEINLEDTSCIIYLVNETIVFYQEFKLTEIGLNMLPKYTIRFPGNNVMNYLLSENNQSILVDIDVSELTVNSSDITELYLLNKENASIYFESYEITQGDSTIIAKFNLTDANNYQNKEYALKYKDKCGVYIDTDSSVGIGSFKFERNYFVLNNNYNDEQKLIIYGPYSDSISLNVLKNGYFYSNLQNDGNSYTLDINSAGNYTFELNNNGVTSPINDKVYVVENLEDLLLINNPPSECYFLNSDKSALEEISFTIKNKIADHSIILSEFSNDGYNFYNLIVLQTSNSKTFSFPNNEENKERIEINKELYFYITEKNYTGQPLYVYHYKYTDIKLNSNYTECIYTDVKYILFEMTCKINNLGTFNFKKSSNTFPFICENFELYSDNIYNCSLSESNSTSNSLLRFEESNDNKYGIYNVYYKDYQLSDSSFYLSHEIATANFSLDKEKQINGGYNTIIKIKTGPNIFYLSNIDYISFKEIKNTSYYFNASLIKIFQDTGNLTASLYVVKGNRYALREICRKKCTYCRNADCQNLNLDNDGTIFENLIYANTKDVTFTVNKHFIALKNSTTDGTTSITEVKITQTGKTDELELINSIICVYTDLNNVKTNETYYPNNNEYTLDLSSIGKYTFYYKTVEGDIFSILNEVVLVSNYDYEIFNYITLTKKCAYYKKNLGIVVSITKNQDYKFVSNVNENKINILIKDSYLFSYQTTESTFQYTGEDDFTYNQGESLNISLVENKDSKFYFTKLSSLVLTDFNIISFNDFYYKDNIILKNQYCDLDNVLISPVLDDVSESRTYYKLNCNYSDVNKISYCKTDYNFKSIFNKNFDVFIGEKTNQPNPIDVTEYTNKIKIYNSIKDADFVPSLSNETIFITSHNFDMTKIAFIRINQNNIFNFNSKKENEITIINNLNNSNNNILNYLQREDHPEDRISTNKIKEINTTLTINFCGEYEKEFEGYKGVCLTCEKYNKRPGSLSKEYYYENGKCVENCDYDAGYCLYEDEFVCKISQFRTKINDNKYICGCSSGTVRKDGTCYLPDDQEILKELSSNPNLQCYDSINNFNYCQNPKNDSGIVKKYTKDCVIYRFSGFDFPRCICYENTTGKYCEFEKNNITLNNSLIGIFNSSKSNNKDIITYDPDVISLIRGIIYILENDKNDDNYKVINPELTKQYINYTNNTIDLIKKGIDTANKNIYDILDLCIFFMKKKIQNDTENNNLRELDETEGQLKTLLEDVPCLHKKANKELSGNYNIQSSNLNQISFITYKKDVINYEDFKRSINDSLERKLSYTGVEINSTKEEILFVTTINRELIDNEEGEFVYVSIKDNNISNINFPFSFYTSVSDNFNFNLAKYYKKKGIDIYKETHEAFTEPCFISQNLPFDLTQKYRKNYVFQKKSLSSPKCTYSDLDLDANKIIFECSGFESTTKCDDEECGILTLSSKYTTIKNANKVYNLPMQCSKKIYKKLETNFGFWTFLFIIVLELIYCLGIQVLTLGYLRKLSIIKGCQNDDFYYGINQVSRNYPITILEKDNSCEENLPKTRIIENVINATPNGVRKYNYQFQYEKEKEFEKKNSIPIKLYTLDLCLIRNFNELHPLASIFRVSIITPLIMSSWFFVFNTLNLFGFNALMYFEYIIERRIYDKNRNNFAYPMRKEFGKIILSILLQVVLAIIFRLITLVTLDERKNLSREIKECKDIYEMSRRVTRFEKKLIIRRIITGSLMLVICIFFYYYCVVFCGIYINTQRNWFFSGIWSLFLNWFVFSPIYIVVVSFLESKERSSYTPLIYYMKKLFCF